MAHTHQVIFVWLLVSAKAAFINFLLEAAKPQSIYLGERRCNILQLGEVKCCSGFDPLPICFIQRLVNDSHRAGTAGKFWMNLCKSNYGLDQVHSQILIKH